MNGVDTVALMAVIVCMALAAAIPALWPRLPLPGVVLEVLLGVIIGPQVLHLAHDGKTMTTLSDLGIALLFLIAGFELDPGVFRGGRLWQALKAWAAGALLASVATLSLVQLGVISGALLTAAGLTTTAIGALLPMLRDQGWLKEPYGPTVLAAGAAGEAAPLVLLSLVLAGRHQAPWQAAVLLAFAALAGLLVAVAGRIARRPFGQLAERTMHMSGQLPLRLVLLLMVTMVLVSHEFQIDVVLSAFVAGAVCRAALPEELHDRLMPRLEGIGYGFLIPIFFLVSGIRLDFATLLAHPRELAQVPLFLAIMLLARGVPALLLYRGTLSLDQRKALALHCSTQLPVVVAISSIAVRRELMPASQAAAMVAAAVISLIVFPALAQRFRPAAPPTPVEEETIAQR